MPNQSNQTLRENKKIMAVYAKNLGKLLAERESNDPSKTATESRGGSQTINPRHREDFESLLNAALENRGAPV